MAKVTIEFDSFEEADELRCALDASKYKLVLWELDQLFRQSIKYESSYLDKSKPSSDMEIKISEKLREILKEYLDQYNLTIE